MSSHGRGDAVHVKLFCTLNDTDYFLNIVKDAWQLHSLPSLGSPSMPHSVISILPEAVLPSGLTVPDISNIFAGSKASKRFPAIIPSKVLMYSENLEANVIS